MGAEGCRNVAVPRAGPKQKTQKRSRLEGLHVEVDEVQRQGDSANLDAEDGQGDVDADAQALEAEGGHSCKEPKGASTAVRA